MVKESEGALERPNGYVLAENNSSSQGNHDAFLEGRQEEGGRGIASGETIIVGENYTSVSDVFVKFVIKLRQMHPARIAWVVFLIFLVTSGNAMQIIGLNFWLRSFPKDGAPGSFTTLAVSSLLFGLFFLVLLLAYIIIVRPSLSYLRVARGWWLLFIIGLADAVNSYMAIYAASYTPEVLQALFTSIVPVYAAVFTKWILMDPRNYYNMWIIVSFGLIVSGVLVASTYHFAHAFGNESRDQAFWSLIFFLSVPPTVLMNVWQSLYMIQFTYVPSFESYFVLENHRRRENEEQQQEAEMRYNFSQDEDSFVDTFLTEHERERGRNWATYESCNNENSSTPCKEEQTSNSIPGEDHASEHDRGFSIRCLQGDDTLVKLVMLAVGTNIQFGLIMLTLPMDYISCWGGSSTVQEAWSNFSEGIWCLFHCNKNFFYCMLYTVGFVFTYVGSAYLNQYSVTLCSMIGQLSSPFTALLLIIVPKWNLEKGDTPWYLSFIAVFLLSVGSFIYALWEEKTEEEKQRGEHHLKMKLLYNMYHSTQHTDRRHSLSVYTNIDTTTGVDQ